MKLLPCLLLFLLSVQLVAQAQEQPVRPPVPTADVSLAVAPAFVQVRDEVLNPTRYQGLGAFTQLAFERRGKQFIHQAGLSFTYANVGNQYDEVATSLAIAPALQYGLLYKVPEPNERFQVMVGGELAGRSHLAYYELWDDSHVYWNTRYTLGARGQWETYRPNGQEWQVRLSVPLVGVASQPPARWDYKVIQDEFGAIVELAHEDLRPMTFITGLEAEGRVQFSFPAFWKLRQSFFYGFHYLHSTLPDSEALLLSRHTLGIAFIY